MFDFGFGLVPAHKHPNGGGWVADTAKVEESVYIGPEARVSGNAWVSGEAEVSGNAWVSGNAEVYGGAWVYGNAWVSKPCSRTPKVLTGFPHIVTVTDNHITVGCQCHAPSVWLSKGPAIIRADGFTSEEAKLWANIINQIAQAHGCVDKEQ